MRTFRPQFFLVKIFLFALVSFFVFRVKVLMVLHPEKTLPSIFFTSAGMITEDAALIAARSPVLSPLLTSQLTASRTFSCRKPLCSALQKSLQML